MDKGDFFYSNK